VLLSGRTPDTPKTGSETLADAAEHLSAELETRGLK
jgi:hypothetical protein